MHKVKVHELLDIRFGKKERGLFALSGILLSLLISSFFLPFGSQQFIVFSITISALFLWLSEFVPLHLTALVIPFSLVVFAGFKPAETLASFFDPIIVLVLGGFAIALSMRKHKVDEYIGQKLIHKGSTPSHVLLGLMVVTALLSMWMANSAAAAIMLPIGLIIIKENGLLRLKSNFAKSLVLGIGFAATIGGLGTIVGSTPNVLTAKFLNQNGIEFGFIDWMYYGLPLMIALLIVAWIVLTVIFRPEISRINVKEFQGKLNRKQKEVLAVFLITIILWLTTEIHGIDIGVISLVPLFLLYALGILNTEDFHKIDWPALILIGGGISLGFAMHASGLDLSMANTLAGMIANQPLVIISMVVIGFGVLLTSFASNTAAASVMIPFMIPVAMITGLDPRTLAVLAGIGVSLDFVMPSGTPPTTIAYSTGYLRLKDLMKAGIIISLIAILVGTMFSVFVWG